MDITIENADKRKRGYVPKHCYGEKHEPKHLADAPKMRVTDIGTYIAAFLLLIGVVALRGYSLALFPLAAASVFFSCYAVMKRATAFSVTALSVSCAATVAMAVWGVILSYAYAVALLGSQ